MTRWEAPPKLSELSDAELLAHRHAACEAYDGVEMDATSEEIERRGLEF